MTGCNEIPYPIEEVNASSPAKIKHQYLSISKNMNLPCHENLIGKVNILYSHLQNIIPSIS